MNYYDFFKFIRFYILSFFLNNFNYFNHRSRKKIFCFVFAASLLVLPLIVGCLSSGYLMDFLGRKRSLFLLSIPFAMGWMILAIAPNLLSKSNSKKKTKTIDTPPSTPPTEGK
mgnify:CR=1 FL=1